MNPFFFTELNTQCKELKLIHFDIEFILRAKYMKSVLKAFVINVYEIFLN